MKHIKKLYETCIMIKRFSLIISQMFLLIIEQQTKVINRLIKNPFNDSDIIFKYFQIFSKRLTKIQKEQHSLLHLIC